MTVFDPQGSLQRPCLTSFRKKFTFYMRKKNQNFTNHSMDLSNTFSPSNCLKKVMSSYCAKVVKVPRIMLKLILEKKKKKKRAFFPKAEFLQKCALKSSHTLAFYPNLCPVYEKSQHAEDLGHMKIN